MKKFLLLGFIPAFVLWLACGGSDGDGGGPTGPSGPTTQRIAANTTAGAPSMTNANDAVWNAVAATAVDISTANSPKVPAPESQAAPDSIYLKAIVDGGRLFLRVEFTNDSLNLLKEFLESIDDNTNFNVRDYSQEDHVIAMFAGLPNNAFDVWHWRSLTTAPAGLAEGRNFESGLMVTDSGLQQVGFANFSGGVSGNKQPTYVHNTSVSFTGQILLMSEMEAFSLHQADYDSSGYIVPGWYVDDSVGARVALPAYKQSRWDVTAVHDYNSTTNRLVVVMSRLLNTNWSDDLVMADSVKAKIGVLDDLKDVTIQGSRRGFSQEFWLIL